jgi:hypothetical protein
VGGLWRASQSKSKRAKKIFKTLGDAEKAYERGDVAMDDTIQILES